MNAAAFASKPHTGRKGKGKADGGVGVCSGVESPEGGVKTSGLSVEPHLSRITVGPTGTNRSEGGTVDRVRSKPGHVAEGADPVADAFWALLERARYTVW